MTERWVKMVEEAIPRTAKYLPGDPSVSAIEAAKLLARQHAAVVRMVKKIGNNATTSQFSTSNECMAWKMACAEILAALATHRKGRT